jgi:tRNA pseudouridine55 synthase
MDGLLVIDKPPGPTSHDVVARLRRVLGERRIGHTGTLDPAASGVLPLVLGRATRLARFMSGSTKRYEAVVRFGQATDTYDADGLPAGERSTAAVPTRGQIDSALNAFRGTFDQQPPAFSAKKVAGRRSYETARANRTRRSLEASALGGPMPRAGQLGPPDLPGLPEPVRVTIHRLDVTDVVDDCVTLDLECSAGFYVRSLAHDLGAALGMGAHLAALRRTASGGLTLADAMPLDLAERSPADARSAVVPLEDMLTNLPAVVLQDEGVVRAIHGRDIGPAEITGEIWAGDSPVRLFDQSGQLVGIGEAAVTSGLLHPSVVLR